MFRVTSTLSWKSPNLGFNLMDLIGQFFGCAKRHPNGLKFGQIGPDPLGVGCKIYQVLSHGSTWWTKLIKVGLRCWKQCSQVVHQIYEESFLGLDIPNGPGKMGKLSQHRDIESSNISSPNFEDLGMSGLRKGRHCLGRFWSWLDLMGLEKL